jgi:hypothetical protein
MREPIATVRIRYVHRMTARAADPTNDGSPTPLASSYRDRISATVFEVVSVAGDRVTLRMADVGVILTTTLTMLEADFESLALPAAPEIPVPTPALPICDER